MRSPFAEDIAIGAVAAEEDEAPQVDGLLQHRLQRVVDVIDDSASSRFLLFGGSSGRGVRLAVHMG